MSVRALLLFGSALAACSPYEGHYMSGDFAGSASYTATVPSATAALGGGALVDVDVTDDVGTNAYNEAVSGSVTLAIGPGCTLTASYLSIESSHGDVEGVVASLSGGQTCQLSFDGVEGTFVVENGQAVTSGTAIDLTIAGEVTTWGGSPSSGFVAWEFHGAR